VPKTSFWAVIAKAGANAFVDVPAQVTRAFAAFAEHGRVRVTGTINGHPPHATPIPTKDGNHRLSVNSGMRAATGVEARCATSWELVWRHFFEDVGLEESSGRKLATVWQSGEDRASVSARAICAVPVKPPPKLLLLSHGVREIEKLAPDAGSVVPGNAPQLMLMSTKITLL
jgi:hypothetical protein